MDQPTRFVGMDVHKETIVVAVTAAGDCGKATPYGTFPNTAALEKLVTRLRQAGSGPLKFCYEAGPCGYGVHRTLTRLGEECMVIAPSMPAASNRFSPARRSPSAGGTTHLPRLWPPTLAEGTPSHSVPHTFRHVAPQQRAGLVLPVCRGAAPGLLPVGCPSASWGEEARDGAIRWR
jgi:hypothetical protein